MDRNKLVAGLKNVDPARGQMQNNITKAFWFVGGTRLMAYNGDMALAVQFKTEFQGAVQETILPLLASSAATECEFIKTDEGMTIKAASSKFKLLTEAPENYLFKVPKFPEDAAFPVKDVPKFLTALKACKRSIGHDVSEPEFKGVTMQADGKTLHMFGYNKLSLTHAQCELKKPLGFEKVIVGAQAVEQLLRITDGATELDMVIDDKTLLARSGGVTLWHRLETMPRNPRDFKSDSAKLRKLAGEFITAPKKMQAMLERACVITQSAIDITKTRITVTDNKIAFHSKSARGIVDDVCMLENKEKHADCKLNVDPKLVLDGLDLGTLAMSDEGFIWGNEAQRVYYFIAGA